MNEIITIEKSDPRFPARLLAIGTDCPERIYCMGNIELLKRENAVAVIGARACDRQGYNKAYHIAKEKAEQGAVIISGLALGCDTGAHRGALDAQGATIAIVGSGLDIVHPRENTALQNEILAKGGLILSEQPLGVKANPTTLVARNRLQAALSNAVILAQCPEHSGSLHTMRFARRYHKRCFAATFPRWTDINAGNRSLLDEGLAEEI